MAALLLVDAGNTSVKWQWLVAPDPMDFAAIMHGLRNGAIEHLANHEASKDALCNRWAQSFGAIKERHGFLIADAVLCWSSVGPKPVAQNIAQAFHALSGTAASAPMAATAELLLPKPSGTERLINDYLNPSQLGADRWMACAGLAAIGGLGLGAHLLVCAGSATTINLLHRPEASTLRFSGGWILPGVRLMHGSLRERTEDLHYGLQPRPTGKHVPRDSQSAITEGIGLAQAGFVQQLMHEHRIVSVTVAGGDAAFWSAAFIASGADPSALRHEPALVMVGLAAAANSGKHLRG